jgi:hypothetical protein
MGSGRAVWPVLGEGDCPDSRAWTRSVRTKMGLSPLPAEHTTTTVGVHTELHLQNRDADGPVGDWGVMIWGCLDDWAYFSGAAEAFLAGIERKQKSCSGAVDMGRDADRIRITDGTSVPDRGDYHPGFDL